MINTDILTVNKLLNYCYDGLYGYYSNMLSLAHDMVLGNAMVLEHAMACPYNRYHWDT